MSLSTASPAPQPSASAPSRCLGQAADLHMAATPGHLLQGPPGMASQGRAGSRVPWTNHGASVVPPRGSGAREVSYRAGAASTPWVSSLPKSPANEPVRCGGQLLVQFFAGNPSPQLYSVTRATPQFPLPAGVQQVLGLVEGPGLRSRCHLTWVAG